MIIQGFPVFLIFQVLLELWAGHAWLGWPGDYCVVNRERRAGAYWTAVGLKVFALVLYICGWWILRK